MKKSLLKAALEVQNIILEQNWRFCFIGGLAVQRWGEPRVTNDVDLTVITEFANEEQFIDILLSRLHPRIEDAREFARAARVLLVSSRAGVGVDIALGGMPVEIEAVARASYFEFAKGIRLLTASPEDLIVMKAFANRDKDWLDIRGVVIRNHKSLDQAYIYQHLSPLCILKEEPEIIERLKSIMERPK